MITWQNLIVGSLILSFKVRGKIDPEAWCFEKGRNIFMSLFVLMILLASVSDLWWSRHITSGTRRHQITWFCQAPGPRIHRIISKVYNISIGRHIALTNWHLLLETQWKWKFIHNTTLDSKSSLVKISGFPLIWVWLFREDLPNHTYLSFWFEHDL